MKVVIAGGGWAGCAAAVAARQQGAEVILVERTDMLLGTGLVGGIMRNNGRFTAAEEMIAMSAGDLFHVIDRNTLHRDIDFPGHSHASLYNVTGMEPLISRLLIQKGISVRLSTLLTDVEIDGGKIRAFIGREGDGKVHFDGDVFIDATGTAGPPGNCAKYGNGCVMCILRCHSFGGRVSLTTRAGIKELVGRKENQVGAMSGSCILLKESVSYQIIDRLEEEGVVVIPLSLSEQLKNKLSIKACQQYAIPDFEKNLVLLDTGHIKLMTPFFPLELLRRIPGFENARYEDPYAGGLGNSIRYLSISPRSDNMKVKGIANLFCAGEKAGLLVGHTEAIVTGTLAGHNAIRYAEKVELLTLPTDLAVGDIINYVRAQIYEEADLSQKYTFSGSTYFNRMKQKGLYITDKDKIKKRVESAGMNGIFSVPCTELRKH